MYIDIPLGLLKFGHIIALIFIFLRFFLLIDISWWRVIVITIACILYDILVYNFERFLYENNIDDDEDEM